MPESSSYVHSQYYEVQQAKRLMEMLFDYGANTYISSTCIPGRELAREFAGPLGKSMSNFSLLHAPNNLQHKSNLQNSGQGRARLHIAERTEIVILPSFAQCSRPIMRSQSSNRKRPTSSRPHLSLSPSSIQPVNAVRICNTFQPRTPSSASCAGGSGNVRISISTRYKDH
jgi:hypothetical protein